MTSPVLSIPHESRRCPNEDPLSGIFASKADLVAASIAASLAFLIFEREDCQVSVLSILPRVDIISSSLPVRSISSIQPG